MATTDVIFCRDDVVPAGRSKNGSMICTCLPTGYYAIRDVLSFAGPTDDAVEAKYTNRFDEPSYYFGNSGAGTYEGTTP